MVTVLFTDMSHSVAAHQFLRAETAADRMSELLTVMVDVVVRYEGTVDRFLGDGLLAVFGAPRARENDPERAIRAALEIRSAAAELGVQVTTGINTGEVYFGEVGPDQHRELTVMGPVVDLAARFQTIAEPGQTLVGEGTYRLTRNSFEMSPLTLLVRGIDHPVTAYAVERALPHSTSVRGIEGLKAELIGRDGEMASLKRALQELDEGRGRMVSLTGEAGLGKSRLVGELKQWLAAAWSEAAVPGEDDRATRAGRRKSLWLEGRCLELTAGASYRLFQDLLRDYFGGRAEESDRQREARIVVTLQDLARRGDLAEDRLPEMAPLLGNLFSIGWGQERDDPTASRAPGGWAERLKSATPEQIKHQTFLAIRDFLVALAMQQPLVLVFEDLHWADSLSLELISFLMDALARAPLFLLCTYRPEQSHRCREMEELAAQNHPERYTRLQLRELTIPESRQLVESLLVAEELSPPVKALILEKSRGNPFFLEEIVRSLIDSGAIYREADGGSDPLPLEQEVPGEQDVGPAPAAGGIWRARPGIEVAAVPESVQSVILSRVDRLAPEARRVLQSAAVIGRLFRRPLLEAVLERPADRGGPASPPATVVDETTVGGDASDEDSVPTRRLDGGLFNRFTSRELEHALRDLEERSLIQPEPDVPGDVYTFRHVLVQETIYASTLVRHREALHQAVGRVIEERYQANLHEYYEQLAYHYKLAGINEKAVEYLLKAGEKARQSYLNAEAADCFRQALERLESGAVGSSAPAVGPTGNHSDEWRLMALTGLGQVHLGTGSVVEAERCFREAIAVARDLNRPTRELVRLYYRLGDVLYWQNQWDELIDIGEEGRALLGEESGSVEAAMMNHIAAVGYGRRQREKQRELVDRNSQFLLDLPYCEELRPAFCSISSFRLTQDNDAPAALAWIEALERRAEQHADVRALGEAHDNRARLLLLQGDLQGAVQAGQRGCELARKIGDSKTAAWCLGVTSHAHLLSGDLVNAEACSREALALMVGDEWDIAVTLLILGTVLLCRSAWDEAEGAFDGAIRLFQGAGYPDAVGAACALARAQWARGKPEEAAHQFQAVARAAKDNAEGLAAALAGLEELYADTRRFRSFCRRLQKDQREPGDPHFTHWHLRSVKRSPLPSSWAAEQFAGAVPPHWSWHDPFGDCSCSVSRGLEIHAANGRDLLDHNRSAPRFLRPVKPEFAFEATSIPASENLPTQGGILLWRDARNFLRLDRGIRGKQELAFTASMGDRRHIIGRGRLDSERMTLRMERRGDCVHSLCSADGRTWHTLGQVSFPQEEPLEVGVYAIGSIDRTLYPSAHTEGASIRFESLSLWS